MKQDKLSTRLDKIIVGIFTFFITLGIIINLYIYYLERSGEEFATHNMESRPEWIGVIVSILFLLVYLLGKKYYQRYLDFLPSRYYYIAMFFSLLSVYLGSYLNFYEAFAWWDVVLHFSSGILLGFFSIIMVSFIACRRLGQFKNRGDVIFLIIIGVLVSISVAVFWEFYEYLYDYVTGGNMQEGLVIKEGATSFDMTPYMYSTGRVVGLDLTDTMFDQLLAVTGAIIAGIYSLFHFKSIQLNIEE